MSILAHLVKRRKEMGLTQMELGQRSGVSLPTIQNIEAGEANPSLQTLQSLGDVLGMEIVLHPLKPDWQELGSCGLPLLQDSERALPPPSENSLLKNLNRAILAPPEDERTLEALQALLLALQTHYPSFYKSHLSKNPLAQKFQVKKVSGRLVKLARLSRAKLGEYL